MTELLMAAGYVGAILGLCVLLVLAHNVTRSYVMCGVQAGRAGPLGLDRRQDPGTSGREGGHEIALPALKSNKIGDLRPI